MDSVDDVVAHFRSESVNAYEFGSPFTSGLLSAAADARAGGRFVRWGTPAGLA